IGAGFSGGGIIVSAVNGVASFSDFVVGTPGSGYTIRVTSGDGRLSVLTAPFDVTVGSPAPPGSGDSRPTILRERVLLAGKGKDKHLVGFELDFSAALDPSRATDQANYVVTQSVRRGRRSIARLVKFTVRYDPASNAVTLLVSGKPAFTRGGQI